MALGGSYRVNDKGEESYLDYTCYLTFKSQYQLTRQIKMSFLLEFEILRVRIQLKSS